MARIIACTTTFLVPISVKDVFNLTRNQKKMPWILRIRWLETQRDAKRLDIFMNRTTSLTTTKNTFNAITNQVIFASLCWFSGENNCIFASDVPKNTWKHVENAMNSQVRCMLIWLPFSHRQLHKYRFHKIQYLNSMNSTAYRARFRQNGQLKCQPVCVPFGVASFLSLSHSLFFQMISNIKLQSCCV